MSCASQSMMNEYLFMNQSSQLGIVPSHISFTYLPLMEYCNQPHSKTLAAAATTLSTEADSLPAPTRSHHHSMNFGASQILSLQSSSANHRHEVKAWGEMSEGAKAISGGVNDLETISMSSKFKKIKERRIVRAPRFCFKTMSDVDVLEDGYKWRKYGKKVVKNTLLPRSYYRCTQNNCRVKKRVERLADDPRMVITTYEGRHIHSPSQQEQDILPSSFFLAL